MNQNGADFTASNTSQNSNVLFTFNNETPSGRTYLYANPIHNGSGTGNPYVNLGVFSVSNGVDMGLGRLNLQGTVLYNFTRLEDQFAPSNTLSNLASSNGLSNLNSNFLTYSNWVNTAYAPSNTLSNVNSNVIALSNWTITQYARSNQLSNYTPTTTTTTLSNWVDGTFRKNSVQVPWTQISGKPNFSDCNDSLSIGGAVLGAAGLAVGGLALLNQNGALTGMLANVASSLRLNPNGYSRFDEGLEITDGAGSRRI
jgi:hypothetical protein